MIGEIREIERGTRDAWGEGLPYHTPKATTA